MINKMLGIGITFGASIIIAFCIGLVAGYNAHEGLAKRSIDDFGKVKLQNHIYSATLERAPHQDRLVTKQQLLEQGNRQ